MFPRGKVKQKDKVDLYKLGTKPKTKPKNEDAAKKDSYESLKEAVAHDYTNANYRK